jgi:SRSO17 transposase
MTPEQSEELAPAFANYLRQFLFCCGHTATFDHLGTYCRGLLSDLPRKSVEPIALASGTAVRTLQEFLKDHAWDHGQARDILQRHIANALPDVAGEDDLGDVGLVDETATIKKGTRTPGVQRQWCGAAGKVENCVVTVHTGVCRGRYKALLDADLYLPKSWDTDRDRCEAAGIPDAVVYRPKWQIALAQLDRTRGNGVCFDWLLFDEDYGNRPGFLAGLQQRQQRYIGEVPRSFRCYTNRPAGRRAGGRADSLCWRSEAFRDQPFAEVRLARQTVGEQLWRAKAARVWIRRADRSAEPTHWLIYTWNERTGERKFFLSNAAADEPLGRLLRAAFCRWNVEHAIRLSKSEIGLSHYEGRNYVGLMRHLTLCLITLAFAAGTAERLRGEKRGGDGGAGVPCVERNERGVAGGVAGDEPVGAHVGGHLLSPAA